MESVPSESIAPESQSPEPLGPEPMNLKAATVVLVTIAASTTLELPLATYRSSSQASFIRILLESTSK